MVKVGCVYVWCEVPVFVRTDGKLGRRSYLFHHFPFLREAGVHVIPFILLV
jgi:hypothetical protein